MKRLILCLALVCLPAMSAAQSGLSDKSLAQLQEIADQIAGLETGPIPAVLVAALIAAEERTHLTRPPATSKLTRQVASMHLGSMQSLKRRAAELALADYLGARMTPARIAEVYASRVYFGRNCYGYQNAVQGLARTTVERADDAVWLALAALPRSPSFYLRDRAALKDRVSGIVHDMQAAGLVDATQAERLKELPLASVDTGPGCSS